MPPPAVQPTCVLRSFAAREREPSGGRVAVMSPAPRTSPNATPPAPTTTRHRPPPTPGRRGTATPGRCRRAPPRLAAGRPRAVGRGGGGRCWCTSAPPPPPTPPNGHSLPPAQTVEDKA